MNYPSAVVFWKRHANARSEQERRYPVVLLILFLSVVTFQTNALADASDAKKLSAAEYRQKAYEEQQRGDLDQALSFYLKANERAPRHANILNDIGVVYESLGLLDKAEQKYLEAISTDRKYLPPYMNLAYFYQRNQDTAKAMEYFEKRVRLGKLSDPWTLKAQQELASIKEGLPFYKQKLIRSEAEALGLQVDQQITEAKKKAQEEADRKIDETNKSYQKGLLFIDQQRFAEAISAFDQALALAPENPRIVKAKKYAQKEWTKEQIRTGADRAVKFLNLGDTPSAQEEIHKMLTLFPNN